MGTVKFFNPTKGYGFIKPEDGGPDVYVHISAVEKAGYTNLAEGARISYELVTKRDGKTAADNLRWLNRFARGSRYAVPVHVIKLTERRPLAEIGHRSSRGI
jgi:CspA family cold shock protein